MKNLFLITCIVLGSTMAWADLGYKVSGESVFLTADNCADLISEARGFSQQSCACTETECSINISSDIPLKMKFLLLQGKPQVFGPNCWNSVLYVKELSPGVNYSDGEMNFWLQSPLCSRVKAPRFGDIVDVSALNERGDSYNSSHSYLYLSPSLGFTKNGPDNTEAYALSSHVAIKEVYGLTDQKCDDKNLAEGLALNCDTISTYYRCEDSRSLISGPRGNSATQELKDVAQLLTTASFSSERNIEGLDAKLESLHSVAKQKLKLPTFQELPLALQSSLIRFFEVESDEEDATFLDYLTEISFLISYPHQRAESERVVAYMAEFRAAYDYSNLSEGEFYYWSFIISNTRSMRTQLTEF